jgi:Glycosyltransferase Family 4
MTPYLIVTGDFVQTGGMDNANYELAKHLAERGAELHLVAHRVSNQITQFANVSPHPVQKPLDSYLLGSPLLNRQGRYWAKRIAARRGRVIVNGGNCQWGDINWVHYVHAAHRPEVRSNWLYSRQVRLTHELALRSERKSLRQARLIICNRFA